jgi:hypothetical protein
MKKRRLFIVLAVWVFCGGIALTSYGIGWCNEPIHLGFAAPSSGERSSTNAYKKAYGMAKTLGKRLIETYPTTV